MARELGILILAGGSSRRFGGEKALFEINGKSMIEHVVERISKLSTEIVISSRSNREKLVEMFPGAKVVLDRWDRRGALTGLMSALPEIRSECVALVTCDCPKIKAEVIELLFDNARGHSGAIPRWPSGYTEPLQAVYKTEELCEAVEKTWKEGKMKLASVIARLPDVAYISTEKLKRIDPELESFLNINSPEDFCFTSKVGKMNKIKRIRLREANA